jgi:alpha-glutamyl/putrescinyl thymine pyrophosphorylase-like protein
VRPRDRGRGQKLDQLLRSFSRDRYPLLGVRSGANRAAFVEQIVESIRRVEFIDAIAKRDISELRVDPSGDLFDPIKAAILQKQRGYTDEAFWLVFLSVHFGKHKRAGWRLVRDVYGSLGTESPWNWTKTSSDPQAFRKWLAKSENALKGADDIERHFGNHRKYQSLDAVSPSGTGAAVESYVKWVRPPRTHQGLIEEAQKEVGDNPRQVFAYLYRSMTEVTSFGRMAKFDYLTMIGKLGLAQIEPGSPYLEGSTGPLVGARLLFGGTGTARISHQDLDSRSVELGDALSVGMQVVEDSLCNWQKSPSKFIPFRG